MCGTINTPLSRGHLYVVTAFIGFTSAIAQIFLIRELTSVFRGNEFIISAVFAAWFSGIYAGARFNRPADRRILERRLLGSMLAFPALLPFVIYTAHLAPVIFPHTPGSFYTIASGFLFTFVLTAPAGYLTGLFFPPAVSLLREFPGNRSGGMIFSIDAAGSFAGGIVFSFYLVDRFNPLAVSAMLAVVALTIYIAVRGRRMYYFALLTLLPAILMSAPIERVFFSAVWRSVHSGNLLEYSRTQYQTISIESEDSRLNIYGNGAYYYSVPDQYSARSGFHLIQSLRRPGDTDILILGGGAGSLVNNLMKTGIPSLYYCETDPGLWKAILPYLNRIYPGCTGNPSFRIVLMDYQLFLASKNKRFDMIYCVPPPPENTMTNRFYTKEFYRLCRNRLSENGIFIARIQGFPEYMGNELKNYLSSVYRSFIDCFPSRLTGTGEALYLIGARKQGILPLSPDALVNRYVPKLHELKKRGVEEEIINNYHREELSMLFEKSKREYFKTRIGRLSGRARANTELEPDAYWHYLLFSALQENSAVFRILRSGFILPLVVLIFIFLSFIRIRRRHGALQMRAALIIFPTGLMSISLVITLVLLFQSFQGIVYYRIALINAVFMLGLAAGAYAAARSGTKFSWRICLVLLASVLLIPLYLYLRSEWIFWAIIPLFSAACGSVFPAVFSVISVDSVHVSASNLDAMDNLGAVAGSVLTAAAFIPFFGIPGTIAINTFIACSLLALEITLSIRDFTVA